MSRRPTRAVLWADDGAPFAEVELPNPQRDGKHLMRCHICPLAVREPSLPAALRHLADHLEAEHREVMK